MAKKQDFQFFKVRKEWQLYAVQVIFLDILLLVHLPMNKPTIIMADDVDNKDSQFSTEMIISVWWGWANQSIYNLVFSQRYKGSF